MQDLVGLQLSSELKRPALPEAVKMLQSCHHSSGMRAALQTYRIVIQNIQVLLGESEQSAVVETRCSDLRFTKCHIMLLIHLSHMLLNGHAGDVRHVEVLSASGAKALNISRVIWVSIEAGPRPWDDIPAIQAAYTELGRY
jgi:hypothetical protein